MNKRTHKWTISCSQLWNTNIIFTHSTHTHPNICTHACMHIHTRANKYVFKLYDIHKSTPQLTRTAQSRAPHSYQESPLIPPHLLCHPEPELHMVYTHRLMQKHHIRKSMRITTLLDRSRSQWMVLVCMSCTCSNLTVSEICLLVQMYTLHT